VDKINPDEMEAPVARKNPERDQVAAAAFVKWKNVNGHSDSAIAKMVGRSAAAVATWRNGTRPMARERDVLQSLTGWHWDTPPGEDYAPTKAKTPKATKTAKAAKPSRPAPDSIEGLMLANTALRAAIASKRKLNPSNPDDALTLKVCVKLLDAEVDRRSVEIVNHQKTVGLRELVLGHRDPKEALAFLRLHAGVDASILDAIEQALPAVQTATAAA
jgi:hypothetical protein